MQRVRMLRLLKLVICAGLVAASAHSVAQTSSGATPVARPIPPTRDPHTPGYVDSKDLPDGTLPAPSADGNFVIGPTHNPAPESSVRAGVPQGIVHEFTMSSADSKFYPGI